MKITETIQRECCDLRKDLKPIQGTPRIGNDHKYLFCIHCGRHHVGNSERDAAGGVDWVYRRVEAPWAEM
jgi:hypothetical protein